VSKTAIRRCQQCHEPVVTIDHGRAYPLGGVVVLCFNPMRVKCGACGHVNEWGTPPLMTGTG
jgi:endogenous inhibitor of DNA gyrase (YacG/DUF329 family)